MSTPKIHQPKPTYPGMLKNALKNILRKVCRTPLKESYPSPSQSISENETGSDYDSSSESDSDYSSLLSSPVGRVGVDGSPASNSRPAESIYSYQGPTSRPSSSMEHPPHDMASRSSFSTLTSCPPFSAMPPRSPSDELPLCSNTPEVTVGQSSSLVPVIQEQENIEHRKVQFFDNHGRHLIGPVETPSSHRSHRVHEEASTAWGLSPGGQYLKDVPTEIGGRHRTLANNGLQICNDFDRHFLHPATLKSRSSSFRRSAGEKRTLFSGLRLPSPTSSPSRPESSIRSHSSSRYHPYCPPSRTFRSPRDNFSAQADEFLSQLDNNELTGPSTHRGKASSSDREVDGRRSITSPQLTYPPDDEPSQPRPSSPRYPLRPVYDWTPRIYNNELQRIPTLNYEESRLKSPLFHPVSLDLPPSLNWTTDPSWSQSGDNERFEPHNLFTRYSVQPHLPGLLSPFHPQRPTGGGHSLTTSPALAGPTNHAPARPSVTREDSASRSRKRTREESVKVEHYEVDLSGQNELEGRPAKRHSPDRPLGESRQQLSPPVSHSLPLAPVYSLPYSPAYYPLSSPVYNPPSSPDYPTTSSLAYHPQSPSPVSWDADIEIEPVSVDRIPRALSSSDVSRPSAMRHHKMSLSNLLC